MTKKVRVGWKEYCALPAFQVKRIIAKVDTGADTSALDARNIKTFLRGKARYVRFDLFLKRKNNQKQISCEARVIDRRVVRSSNGERERRYVIETAIVLGQTTVMAQMTLADRSTLSYRMLLGRDFLAHCLIDVGSELCQGLPVLK